MKKVTLIRVTVDADYYKKVLTVLLKNSCLKCASKELGFEVNQRLSDYVFSLWRGAYNGCLYEPKENG